MHSLKSFNEFTYLSESVHNFFKGRHDNKRDAWAKEVYAILEKSYARIGGLKGNGLSSPEDMIANIPMWKLARKNNRIVAVVLYKDKNGRKTVAIGTDGSREGKKELGRILREEALKTRSYSEVSGAALNFRIKYLPPTVDVASIAIPLKDVKMLIPEAVPAPDDDPEVRAHPSLKEFFYQREIGGHMHTKIMLGTLFQKIT